MDRWEYLTTFLEADVPEALARGELTTVEAESLGRNAPEALIPELNRLGAKGWELVYMAPVFVGANQDILLMEGGGMRRWSSTYFCVFKRRA